MAILEHDMEDVKKRINSWVENNISLINKYEIDVIDLIEILESFVLTVPEYNNSTEMLRKYLKFPNNK